MDKSPDAFRTISEVADDLDLPQHVLRFWETRFPQIKPLKRGGGRRYYRPDDVDLLKGIRRLLYGEGYTIKGVQRILKEGGVRSVQSMGRGGEIPTGRASAGSQVYDVSGEDAVHGSDEADEDDEFSPGVSGDTAQASAEPVSAFDQRDIEHLRAAYDELRECERILKALRPAAEPASVDEPH
jgi:DNA-binding transcriptional MerR regulator